AGVPFTAIVHQGTGTVTILQTGKEDVASDDANLGFAKVANRVLYLDGSANFRVQVKDLQRLEARGGTIKGEDLNLHQLDIELYGSASIELAGRVDDLKITANAAGNFNGEALKAKKARVVAYSSATLVVNVSDELNARAYAKGSIEYLGSPKVDKQVFAK